MAGMHSSLAAFNGLDLLASAVLLLDERLTVRYLNPAGENLLAVSLRAATGKPLAAVCTCSATLQAALDNAIENNWGYTGQNVEFRRADGEQMQTNCTVTPVDAEGARLASQTSAEGSRSRVSDTRARKRFASRVRPMSARASSSVSTQTWSGTWLAPSTRWRTSLMTTR